MIIVIQCAARKRDDAGRLRTKDGRAVLFVGRPEAAPPEGDTVYARPDDGSDDGTSWRDRLLRYNAMGSNPLGLCRAAELYLNPVYLEIVRRVGLERTYLLSAGWGLLAGGFLTPDYDITFSAQADAYKRRDRKDHYRDLHMLPDDVAEPIVFVGGRNYLPMFCETTRNVKAPRLVFYNAPEPPDAPGCTLVRYETRTKTNWHYECARAFLDGSLPLS